MQGLSVQSTVPLVQSTAPSSFKASSGHESCTMSKGDPVETNDKEDCQYEHHLKDTSLDTKMLLVEISHGI